VINRCSSTHSTESDTIDLVIRLESDTRVFYAYIAEYAGVILRIRTSIKCFVRVEATLNQAESGCTIVGLVGRRVAEEDETTP
jgi:hypothetical protein